MRYVHNIVIYDDKTDWFGTIGTQICSCEKCTNLIKNAENMSNVYGYISIELEDPFEDATSGIDGVYILCYSEFSYNEAYNRCCEAILNHPKAIDLRGLSAKLVDSLSDF